MIFLTFNGKEDAVSVDSVTVGQSQLVKVAVGRMGTVDLEGRDVTALTLFRSGSDRFGDKSAVTGTGCQDDVVSRSRSHVSEMPRLIGKRVRAEFDFENGIGTDTYDNFFLCRILHHLRSSTDLNVQRFRLNRSLFSFDFVDGLANEFSLVIVGDVFDEELSGVTANENLLAGQHLEPLVPRGRISFGFASQQGAVVHLGRDGFGGTDRQNSRRI